MSFGIEKPWFTSFVLISSFATSYGESLLKNMNRPFGEALSLHQSISHLFVAHTGSFTQHKHATVSMGEFSSLVIENGLLTMTAAKIDIGNFGKVTLEANTTLESGSEVQMLLASQFQVECYKNRCQTQIGEQASLSIGRQANFEVVGDCTIGSSSRIRLVTGSLFNVREASLEIAEGANVVLQDYAMVLFTGKLQIDRYVSLILQQRATIESTGWANEIWLKGRLLLNRGSSLEFYGESSLIINSHYIAVTVGRYGQLAVRDSRCTISLSLDVEPFQRLEIGVDTAIDGVRCVPT